MRHFVISDIHGDLNALVSLLDKWNGEDKLVFLGDLVSRGKDSYEVIKLVMKLVKSGKGICIKGNHEYTFCGFLKKEEVHMSYVSIAHNGIHTIESFLVAMEERGIQVNDITSYYDAIDKINLHFKEEVEFLHNLPYYYEHGDYLFVHAGVDINKERLLDNLVSDVIYASEEFYHNPHALKKRIVFGHMPTYNFGVDNGVFISEDKTKIGMDGGGCFAHKFPTASVNACVINTSKRAKTITNYRYYSNTGKVEKNTYKL